MPLTDQNKLAIAFKKVSGKSHTQQNFASNEEGIGSNVSISYKTIFGEDIQPNPTSVGGLNALFATDGIVEKVRFDLEIIPDTQVGTNQSQGYALKLPSNYTVSGALGGTFSGGTYLHKTLGKLQLVPSYFGSLKSDGTTEYEVIPYQTNGTTVIPKFDGIDWYIDPYAGIFFIQDPNTGYDVSSARPAFLEGYLYVGEYLDEKLLNIANSGTTEPAGVEQSVQFKSLLNFSGVTNFRYSATGNTLLIGTRTGSLGQNGLLVGQTNTLSGNFGAVIGQNNIVAGNYGFATGNFTTANGVNSSAFNKYTQADAQSSFAGGEGLSTRKVIAGGIASFNFSFNNALQGNNHGAIANYSAILGGINNNIEATNIGSIILGGNTIKLTGSNYTYTTAVQNLAIFGSLTGGSSGDVILTLNPATKKIRSRTTAEILAGFTTAKGPTGSVQYNSGSGEFSGSSSYYFEPISRSLSLGTRSGSFGLYSFTAGLSVEGGGSYSAAFGNNTNANGIGSFAAGLNTSSVGEYSFSSGEDTFSGGRGSFASGFGTLADANYSYAIGQSTYVTGIASFVGGQGDPTRPVRTGGVGSFNFSYNNTNQTSEHGNFGNYSAILGGINNHIDSGNSGSVILGGNGIKLLGTTYSGFTAVQSLAIWSLPESGDTSTSVLVYDEISKKVKRVSQSSVQGITLSATNGLNTSGTRIRLGGQITGNTTLYSTTNRQLIFSGMTVIFGNHTSTTGNTNCVIIGGNNISLTGSSFSDYAVLSNLAIWNSPATGSGTDFLLVYDQATKKVKKIAQNQINATGNTQNNVGTGIITTISYTGNSSSDIIAVSATTATNVFLPSSPIIWQKVTVADVRGTAGSFNITVNGNGKQINGVSSALINSDYGSTVYLYNGTSWTAIAFS